MEFLLIAPTLLLITLLVIQWAVRLQAERLVDAAAREGAVAAAGFHATASQGEVTARAYLSDLDADVHAVTVTASRDAATARVQVRAEAMRLIPFFDVSLSSTAEQPVEIFVP